MFLFVTPINKSLNTHEKLNGGAQITYSCSHQDGAASRSELMERLLSVSLGSISVDAGAGVTLVVKEVFQSIGSFLGFHKHQSQRVFACVAGNKGRDKGRKAG